MQYISIIAIPLMICGMITFGLARRVNVYETFVEGAWDGLQSLVKIVAPLVGLMVAISVFRVSGTLELLACALKPVTDIIKLPGEVLPLALLRPISGSGSLAIVSDIFKVNGPDSAAGNIASVMMGSCETTFYTLTVYFGSAGIKKIRHTLKAALLADLTGMIMSALVVYMLMK